MATVSTELAAAKRTAPSTHRRGQVLFALLMLRRVSSVADAALQLMSLGRLSRANSLVHAALELAV